MRNFLIGLCLILILILSIVWDQMKEIEQIAIERGKEIIKLQQVLYENNIVVY